MQRVLNKKKLSKLEYLKINKSYYLVTSVGANMLFLVLGRAGRGAAEIQTAKPILTITLPPETGEETLRQRQPDLKFIHQLI